MKKLFTLLTIVFCIQTLLAADYQKNIIGIRGGLSMSNMTSHGILATYRTTCLFGISDEVLLTSSAPLYIETGAYLIGKGYRIKGYNNSKTKLWYVQIPLLLNYHIHLNDAIYFEPHAGLYYAYAFNGKRKYEGKKIDVINEKQVGNSDFGFSCGLGLSIHQFHMGAKYELGFLNLAKSEKTEIYKQELGYDKLRNRSFSIYIGYNF